MSMKYKDEITRNPIIKNNSQKLAEAPLIIRSLFCISSIFS